tara:strand:+ start:2484 stop:3359 length:876 start_codon:yes stop_codon:yes gene_type:complete
MSNYSKTTNFATKDALASGNPLKTIKGTEFNVEFDAIEVASATKANIAAPTFTGVPSAPTASVGTDTTQIATTAFANASATAAAAAALPKSGGAMTGAITTNSTFDGVDIATRDGVLSTTVTTANAALPKSGGAMTGPITTNSTFDGVDIATRDAILTSTTTTANAALPKAGGALTGALTTNSTFDGRDVATDGTKLDNVATPVITGTNTTATNASSHVVSAGGITITLPASPSAGNYVIIKDGTGAAATTTFTVARNGSNIASSASDLTFDKNFAEIVMTYVNATIGWSV